MRAGNSENKNKWALSTPKLPVVYVLKRIVLLYCCRCLSHENVVFDAKKAKTNAKNGLYSWKVTAQTRITVHEHESTAEFSVTPLFAGAAWRVAVETAVCVHQQTKVLR